MVIRHVKNVTPARLKQMVKRDIKRNANRIKHGQKPMKVKYK